MFTITKIFTFEAAHHLPSHTGKCRKVHGHTYKLEVTVTGRKQNIAKYKSDSAMVMDFHELKDLVEEHIISQYDHTYLNDMFLVPTAEAMIERIGLKLQEVLPPGVEIKRLHLWEGRDSYVGWKPDKSETEK